MKVIKSEKKLCPCCMEEHEVKNVLKAEHNVFKGESVTYDAEYFYCDRADEFYEDERQISSNDISMKNAYRLKAGLLTSDQIAAIRAGYGISQKDLCALLGWGGKTITRYESHQVQDMAHDMILRKLEDDPEWFLQLLQAGRDSVSATAYRKYKEAGTSLFEKRFDLYLKSAIMSKYAGYLDHPDANGGKTLSLDVVCDMIRYYSDSELVVNPLRMKLMKMLWYADALSFMQRGQAISGLVYRATASGAVPLAYESIIDLRIIRCEEIYTDQGIEYTFLPSEVKQYPHLSGKEREILDIVIKRFGHTDNHEITEAMMHETAIMETALHDIIQFRSAYTLSLS